MVHEDCYVDAQRPQERANLVLTEQAESRDIWKVTVNCKGLPVKFILNF